MDDDRQEKLCIAAAIVRYVEQVSWLAYENGSWNPPITAEKDFRKEAAEAAKELRLTKEDGIVEDSVIDEIIAIFHQKSAEELDAILESSRE